MTTRRPMGALEDHVMEYLWVLGAAATPGDVHAAVAPELAYTTIMTVLTRLWSKGRLTRERQGRSFVYEPVRSEAEYRADTMSTALGDANNREAVLSSFVDALDERDLDLLRGLLGEDT